MLENIKTPQVLHIATHGFFLEDSDYSRKAGSIKFRGLTVSGIDPNDPLKYLQSHPLMRSGIALSGANQVNKQPPSDSVNGIVTAEEFLGIDLRDTNMVVLSACNTGLGHIKTGEGVYGLRRAISRAGAKSIVMSLWSVPDLETKEMMAEFYNNLVSEQMNRAIALRVAASKQREIIKKRYGNEDPRFWGGFIFLGEP